MRDEESLFAEVVGAESPAERAAALERACAGDPGLRLRVEGLLAAHDKARGILDVTPPGLTAAADDCVPSPQPVGSFVGPYKLLEQIGEGGMGAVYMAEQQRPVRRMVALKIIKPGMDTRQAIARFEAERQALALMDHPNIAKVLDAGSTDAGRLYFVMELVKGVPITEYCDGNKLTPRERLDLFVQVCHAVQHAHQKGLIHRDIKPSNVLVTLQDGRPAPKVIDFGIAKATGANRLTELTLFTNFAHAFGTPMYMSPEQAAGALDVDTRSDVYSLGVLLYELLTGATPFDKARLAKAAWEEVCRIIRYEEPPRPSTRIGTLGATLTAVSSSRATEPRKLGQLVRGELDWIVMKALEKDRGRRYETASAFAEDVRRHLEDKAVEACPPSAGYRLRKVAARHRAALSAAAAFAAVLMAGVGVSTWMAVRAVAAQGRAAAEAEAHRQARSEAEAARRVAQAAGRETERHLADALVAVGDAHATGGQFLEAVDAYDRARQVYEGLGVSAMPAESGLAAVQEHARPPLMEWRAHPGDVHCLAVAPGDRWVVSGGSDGAIHVWEAPTGLRVRTLKRSGAAVRSVAFAADGRVVASGDNAGVVCLWDAADGTLLREFRAHQQEVWGIAFSHDGTLLATTSHDHTAAVWRVRDGSLVARQTDVTTRGVAFTRAGDAVILPTSQACAWRFADGATETLPGFGANGIVAVSPDGTMVATGTHSGANHLLRFDDRTVRSHTAHRGPTTGLAFTADGRQLVSVGSDNRLSVYDVGGRLASSVLIRGPVGPVSVAGDGTWAASAGSDGMIRLWDLSPRAEIGALGWPGAGPGVASVAVSPDNWLVATAGGEGLVVLWDRETGRRLFAYQADCANAVAFSPAGDRLAFNAGELVCVVDLAAPGDVRRLGYHDEPVKGIAFSPDGRRLLTTTGVSVRVWDVEQRERLWTRQAPDGVFAGGTPGFARDGWTVAAVGEKGYAVVYDAATGRPLSDNVAREAWGRGVGSGAAFTSDARAVVADAVPHGQFGLFDALANRPIRPLAGTRHTSFTHGVAVSPDDRWAATASSDGTVKLWDLAEGREVRTLGGFGGRVGYVTFSADGRLLLAGGFETPCHLIDLGRPARHRALAGAAADARRTVGAAGAGGAGAAHAWCALGEWYAFRKRWAWAAEAFEKARSGGADVPSPLAARCLWQCGDAPGARREFARALERQEAPAAYVALCAGAMEAAPSARVVTAEQNASRGAFAEAAEEYAAQVAAGPTTHLPYFRAACLRLHLGDVAGYRRVCRLMVDRYANASRADDAEMTARACLLSPDLKEDAAAIQRLARYAAVAAPDSPWAVQCLGLAHLRRGEPEEALRHLSSARGMLARNSSLFHPQTLLLSALSLQALGRGEEARAAMDEAVALLAAGGSDPQRPPVGSAWADWIICRQFRSEAEAALRPHETNPVAPSTSDARRR